MHVVIVYGSKEGQTAKIADHIAQIVRNRGLDASTYSGKDIPASFTTHGFDAAIVGGSIHIGKYPAYLREFVVHHRDWLNKAPSAFFTVCMAIQSQNAADREEAENFGKRFIETTHQNLRGQVLH
jgi:menaquinone-dependent protoporphyrinogen oxidase